MVSIANYSHHSERAIHLFSGIENREVDIPCLLVIAMLQTVEAVKLPERSSPGSAIGAMPLPANFVAVCPGREAVKILVAGKNFF